MCLFSRGSNLKFPIGFTYQHSKFCLCRSFVFIGSFFLSFGLKLSNRIATHFFVLQYCDLDWTPSGTIGQQHVIHMIHTSFASVSGWAAQCAANSNANCIAQYVDTGSIAILATPAAYCNACGAISVHPPPPPPPLTPTTAPARLRRITPHCAPCHTNIFSRFSLLVIKLNSKKKKQKQKKKKKKKKGENNNDHAAAAAFVLKHLLTASSAFSCCCCCCGAVDGYDEVWSRQCPPHPQLNLFWLILLFIVDMRSKRSYKLSFVLYFVCAVRTKRHTQADTQIHTHTQAEILTHT